MDVAEDVDGGVVADAVGVPADVGVPGAAEARGLELVSAFADAHAAVKAESATAKARALDCLRPPRCRTPASACFWVLIVSSSFSGDRIAVSPLG
jgi:hypothetical protein